MAGLIIGFAAGLCLDIAPPGSELLGQYALVFCLAGWAAGRLSGTAGRSAVRALVIAAAVIAVAEALVAAVGLALEPATVTTAAVRDVLPTTIGYDLLLCPFVLYLIVLATALLSDGMASTGLAGVLATATRSERAAERKRRKLLEPRLGRAAVRPGDGWLGGGPRVPYGTRDARPSNRAGVRLRPANGVAGSATGLVRTPGRAVHSPVNLKLTGRKRRDGSIASAVGTGLGQHWRPSRHPGLLAGAAPSSGRRPGSPAARRADSSGSRRPRGGRSRPSGSPPIAVTRLSAGRSARAGWHRPAPRRGCGRERPGPRPPRAAARRSCRSCSSALRRSAVPPVPRPRPGSAARSSRAGPPRPAPAWAREECSAPVHSAPAGTPPPPPGSAAGSSRAGPPRRAPAWSREECSAPARSEPAGGPRPLRASAWRSAGAVR